MRAQETPLRLSLVSTDFVHRELLLPTPVKDPPEISPLVWSSGDPFWLEIHRETSGRVRYSLGSEDLSDLESMVAYLESTRPRLAGGGPIECPAATLVPQGIFARAVPVLKHHHLPIQVRTETDPAGFLLRILGSSTLRDHEVVLQLLFRRVGFWEMGFFSPLYDTIAERQAHELRGQMEARQGEAAYRIELRTNIKGPQPEEALLALDNWLGQWMTSGGKPWRRWKLIRPKAEWGFHAALAAHDLRRFSSRKARRDVSATELAHLLSIPWAAHHPACSYAGAPRGQPGSDLVVGPPPPSRHGPRGGGALALHTPGRSRPALPEASRDPRLVVGACGSHRVGLPRDWHHAAILGRTQSGKSTLALNLVLQVLAKDPGATVVVVEPTGTLVDGIVSRLPREIASETVEIEPAHATFQQGDATMVSVPLSLLRPPECADGDASSRDRWSEALAGDLLAAIRSSWGEESIGGRAELVLRALVQGLALTQGSNLVDAYHILTSKQALQRFVKTAPPGPLRDFLEHHLPRLDYNFTMSTLDKVGKIATNPLLRVALCQRSHAVAFDQLLRHRLLLLNLSKAALGADGANFLGAIYLTQLWAAIQRSGRPDKPVYLVLDEVHNYAVPALADMLSEGAKYGLHVIAATQYLHRVPPRIQAALLGNVDVWLLFSLGVEDMEDAWKIVNGEGHGWTPQDLVDGLRPHEVAMAASGGLVKLETRPGPDSDPHAKDLKDVVAASSRRYAQPEDSEASAWLVDQDDLEAVLNGLAHRSRTLDELGGITSLRPDKLAAAMRRSEEAGDVERDSEEQGRVHLTPRGSVRLSVLLARRNEGEDHVETLTDLVMWLGTKHIEVTIPEQVAGVLMPDGQFRYGDAVYNVEVESSTVAKATEQVIRNVRKAREAGNRVLIALPDASNVQRVLAMLDGAFPGLRLWPDGVGLVWRREDGMFQAHRVPGSEVWPFLEDKEMPGAVDFLPREELSPSRLAATDPLPGALRQVIERFLRAGKVEATLVEFLSALRESNGSVWDEQRVGIALKTLGLESRRSRIDGIRHRVYELRGSRPVAGRLGAGGPDVPTAWPDLDFGPPVDQSSKSGRDTEPPRGDCGAGPTDPAGPDD